ncbi:MAG: hypothetical protein ACI8TQ_002792 [Planctomycetota bacterium]|jgi:hypothetical protein
MIDCLFALVIATTPILSPTTTVAEEFEIAGVIASSAVDIEGVVHNLGADQSVHPVTFVFIDTECPISNRFAPRLNELHEAATEVGVAFYGVLSTPGLTVKAATNYRDEYKLRFPILFDRSGDLAKRLRPTHVPEAFVVDRLDQITYRGRIDDRFAAVGKPKTKFSSHDLLDAINAVSEGTQKSPERTDPIGCLFEAWATPIPAEEVTYSRDIAPILNANCVQCHRPDDVAPFALQTFEQASKRAGMIAMVTGQRIMPPWRAERGFGRFRDERFLSSRQIDLLKKWADSGAPRGDAKDELPLAPVSETRWRLGEPDLEVQMPMDYPVPAAGEDIYRYFVIPSESLTDKAVASVDFRPGNPAVVHHCLAYIDYSGWAREQDAKSDEPGFAVWGNDLSGRMQPVTGWAPGSPPSVYPDGIAMELKRGGDFVLEVHYHPNGKATTDKSALALYFTDEPIEKFADTIFMGTEDVDIEAGDGAYARRIYMDVPADITLIDVLPHMHFIGRSVEAFATTPDGQALPLIKISDWDFRWQDTYVYREPLRLPKGSRINAFFEYDNTAANPFNPNSPPARIQEGWQTTDEMCIFYMTVVVDDPAQRKAVKNASMQSFMNSANPWE